MMNSRERIVTVLEGGIPDRVPWFEHYIGNKVTAGLLGHEDFMKTDLSEPPGQKRISPEIRDVIPLDTVCYGMAPPRFVKTKESDGILHVTDGLIKTKDDLKLLENLPDPDDELIYRAAEEYLNQARGDAAAVVVLRAGVANTYLSMGIDHFCLSLIEDPELVVEIMNRFCDWSLKVVSNIKELPFDICLFPEDMAFKTGPFVSPDFFCKYCMPVMKRLIDSIELPIVYHSDGNIFPLMDDLISLGLDGIANFEPAAIDIEKVKRDYGEKVTLIGNIDLNYTLTTGSPEETRKEVKKRLNTLSQGGRYMLSSANCLPDYVKPENVKAMAETLIEYGEYEV